MFDRLIEFFFGWLEYLKFLVVVDCWQRAVVLRFGKFHRELPPGIHWLIPLCVEQALCETVVANTAHIRDQSLITSDGRDVTVSAVITYQIDDVRKFLLEVEGSHAAVSDIAYGALAEWVTSNTLDRLREPKSWRTIATVIRKAGEGYGINVLRVAMADITRSRTFRLIGDK